MYFVAHPPMDFGPACGFVWFQLILGHYKTPHVILVKGNFGMFSCVASQSTPYRHSSWQLYVEILASIISSNSSFYNLYSLLPHKVPIIFYLLIFLLLSNTNGQFFIVLQWTFERQQLGHQIKQMQHTKLYLYHMWE